MPRAKKTDLQPWQAKALAKASARSAKRPATSDSSIISIKGGIFSFQGAPLAEELDVVILDETIEYSYYDKPFNESEFQTPICWALGTPLSEVEEGATMEDDLAPHEKCSDPQNRDCASCEKNQFGSAQFGTGRGKACGNRIRLLIMAADNLDDPGNAMTAIIKIPPTGMSVWNAHADWLFRIKKLVPEYCVTRMSLKKLRPTDQSAVPHFEFVGTLPDDVIAQVDGLIERSKHLLLQPFMDAQPQQQTRTKRAAPQRARVTKKKATRRKT